MSTRTLNRVYCHDNVSLSISRVNAGSTVFYNVLLALYRLAHPSAGLSRTFLATATSVVAAASDTTPGGFNPPRGATFTAGMTGGSGLLCGTTVPGGSGGGGGGGARPAW